MRTRFTSQWLAEREARNQPPEAKQAKLDLAELRSEEDLHDMIISWCRRQDPQIPYGHGSMAHKTKRTAGEPDFYLLMPGGRLLMVECKTETGELSDDQKQFAASAVRVGHKVHLVRNYPEFLKIVSNFATPEVP